jgi:hypothetical protein
MVQGALKATAQFGLELDLALEGQALLLRLGHFSLTLAVRGQNFFQIRYHEPLFSYNLLLQKPPVCLRYQPDLSL